MKQQLNPLVKHNVQKIFSMYISSHTLWILWYCTRVQINFTSKPHNVNVSRIRLQYTDYILHQYYQLCTMTQNTVCYLSKINMSIKYICVSIYFVKEPPIYTVYDFYHLLYILCICCLYHSPQMNINFVVKSNKQLHFC